MQTTFDVIELSKIIGALSVILGLIIGVYKLYDKITDKQAAHDRDINEMKEEHHKQIEALKEENKSLRAENQREIKKINKENTLICEALVACLDGLEQLGANHTVPEAKSKLSKHLNNAAHDEE